MAIKSVSYDGYQFDVDMDCFDDVRFFELSDKLESDPKLHVDVLKLAIGDKGYEKFSSHFMKKDGRLKMSAVIGAVAAIFGEADPKESASGNSEKNTQTN